MALIRIFVVNVPFLDEWEWSPMVMHVHEHSLTLDELLRLHNEQRITVPSLMAVGLIAVRHSWVVTRETTLSVSLVFASLAVWWLLIVRLVPEPRREWCLALVSLLACSLTQAENWTWGFQMSFFISNLCAAVITVCFVFTQRRWSLPVALAALVVATYSIGFGLTATASGMVFYAFNRERRKLVVWTVVSVVILALYRHDFHASLYQSTNESLVARICQSIAFATIALGAPIARAAGLEWSGLVGAFAIAVWAVLAFTNWPRGKARDGSLALLALAVMPILGSLEIAYGRLFEGFPAALGSRFTTPLSLLWIALVFLIARQARPRLAALTLVPLAILWLSNQVDGYTEIRDHSLSLFAAAQVIPRWTTASEDEFPPVWPAEAEFGYLSESHDGPFLTP